jgi:thiamine pyrophosphokinase
MNFSSSGFLGGVFLKIIIFANGSISNLVQASELTQNSDMIIAADGGARHCLAAAIFPRVVVGDFDSLTPAELDELKGLGARLIRYPARKDFTDLELALEFACEQGADQITILGGLGQRWDQTLANILLLAGPFAQSARVSYIDGNQEIMLIRHSQKLEITGQPGDTVSLIPIQGNAEGITTRGLEYPLEEDTLEFGAARGVSNILIGEKGTVHLKQGFLICIVIHQEVL